VLATARQVSSLDDLPSSVVKTGLDVRDPEQCEAAVKLAATQFGGIDVLVNNAGYGQFGVVEEVSDSELAAQFDTNVFGPWRMTRAVMPMWREHGGGHAIFVSSVSGSVPIPGLSAYTASKFALEGLAESLAQESAHLGVKVTIMQLGGFATSYGPKASDAATRVPAYEAVVAEMLGALRTVTADNPYLSSPAHFADLVHRIAAMPQPPLRVPFGAGAREYLEPALDARRRSFDDAIAAGFIS